MKYFLNEIERWIDTDTLLKVLNLDISTIQRSVKNCMKKKFCRGLSRTWTEEAMFSNIKSIQELK
jgi:predicted transcriptional regulator